MKKTKILFVLLFLWVGLLPLAAQSVRITQELTLHPFATVLPMYKNEFGSFEKPKMTDTFPFAVIRMHLEGNAQAVKAAKELFTLDMGQHTGVESKCTTYSNQILFLVPARRPYIYIDCGDGCDQVLLSNMQQLKSNRVYDCTVLFMPAEVEIEGSETVDREQLKQELLAEIVGMLKEQNTSGNNEQSISSQESFTPVEPTQDAFSHSNIHNAYEYVDLGLSVKWATCNVGANNPEDYGDYFAWGETDYGDYFAWGETKSKTSYLWSTYKYCNGSYNTLKKYNTSSSYGTMDHKTQLELSDDAAHVNWGGAWRMPTDAEWTELREQCTWTWTTQNGVYGRKVTSKTNGNSIFLPAAGYSSLSSVLSAGSYGYYWSSSLYTGSPDDALGVFFSSSKVDRGRIDRYGGQSVRPVCP